MSFHLPDDEDGGNRAAGATSYVARLVAALRRSRQLATSASSPIATSISTRAPVIYQWPSAVVSAASTAHHAPAAASGRRNSRGGVLAGRLLGDLLAVRAGRVFVKKFSCYLVAFPASLTQMGKMSATVKPWTPHRCLSCDFCIADERELEEALAPGVAIAQPDAANAGNRTPRSHSPIPVVDASEAIRRQEAQFGEIAGH